MLRVTLKNLNTKLSRLILTILSIALGVAFLSGTLTFKEIMQERFDEIVASSLTDDLYVVGQDNNATLRRANIPDSLAEKVRDLKGVKTTETNYTVDISIRDAKNHAFKINTYAPVNLNSLDGFNLSKEGYKLSLDEYGAQQLKVKPGDTIKVRVNGLSQDFTVEKTNLKLSTSTKGATILFASPETVRKLLVEVKVKEAMSQVEQGFAQAITQNPQALSDPNSTLSKALETKKAEVAQEVRNTPVEVSNIGVTANKGVKVSQLKEKLEKLLAEQQSEYKQKFIVKTKTQLYEENVGKIRVQLSFINIFMLVFVGISLFASTFTISNTLKIIIRSQLKQLAMLRTIGASRKQLFWSVIYQAVFIALIGTIIGLLLGYGISAGLLSFIEIADLSLSNLTPAVSTIVICTIVATLTTCISAIAPAVMASRTSPMEAMRENVISEQRVRKLPLIFGALLVFGGIQSIVIAFLVSDTKIIYSLVPIGAVTLMIGLLLVQPVLILGFMKVIAVLAKPFGMGSKLALRNIMRTPNRVAVTACALMVSIVLITIGTVFANSATDSLNTTFGSTFKSSLIVNSATSGSIIKDKNLPIEIAKIKGVESDMPTALYMLQAKKDSTPVMFMAVHSDFDKYISIKVESGSAKEFAKDQEAFIATNDYAKANNLKVGSKFELVDQDGKTKKFKVIAIADKALFTSGFAHLDYLKDTNAMVSEYTGVLVNATAKTNIDKLKADIQHKIDDIGDYTVLTKEETLDATSKQVDSILQIIYVLLGLSIVISILGIVNTQVLSINERVQEIGLLRIVGYKRSSVFAMIIRECVLVALYSSVIGLAVGTLLSTAFMHVIVNSGASIDKITYPSFNYCVTIMILSLIVGIIASVIPSLKAIRIKALEAIKDE